MLEEQEKQGEEREGEPPSGIMASTLEVLRQKKFGECTPDELAALRALMARFRLIPPKRLTRRQEKAHKGAPADLRDHRAEAMRQGGEITELCLAQAQVPPAPADPDPGHLGLDGHLLAGSAAVRLRIHPGARQDRGVLLRHPAYPDHRHPPEAQPRRGADRGHQGGLRLGGRHQDRRIPGPLPQAVGPQGHVPRVDPGDLLGRAWSGETRRFWTRR